MSETKCEHAVRTIEKKVEVGASVDAVWKAWTHADDLTRWFPLEARVEPSRGGKIFLSLGPECDGTALISI
jgi:uncharacterized protein YndB with AHSA1/START domain